MSLAASNLKYAVRTNFLIKLKDSGHRVRMSPIDVGLQSRYLVGY
jgi:hypothetical protein